MALPQIQLAVAAGPTYPQVEHQPGDDDAREYVADDADHQRDGEALQRTGAVLCEHQACDNRGHVTVDDRGERAFVSDLDRRAHALTEMYFFAYSFVDQ